ncbi:MAG: 4,4-diaponeurosporenoate glycosyltransferase [Thermosipho sp. (in: thermotogales)]|nr:4,4-diaponeurosporenoate glycosyltransferase [Thermosipho sp. (in: thermotogales)]
MFYYIFIVFSYFLGWFFYINYKFVFKSSFTDNKYKISVIIPARNEERNLPKLLNSLSLQTYPIHEIIVVNDNSTDNTSNVVQSFYNAKLVNLTDDPPDDWLGKPWACWNGFKSSSGDLLIFIDADVELSKYAIESLISLYDKHKGLVSVWPYQRMEKRYEHFNYFFNIGAVTSATILKIFGKSKHIGAFGPLVITSREDYIKTGGHSAVNSEIVEDLKLGQVYMENGISINNYLGNSLIKFRMYPNGFKELFEGITKNMASGLMRSNFTNTFLILIWYLGILYSFPISLSLFKIIHYLSYVIQFRFLTKKTGDYDLLDAFIYPIYFVFFFFSLLISVYKTIFQKKVTWKNREVIFNNSNQADD